MEIFLEFMLMQMAQLQAQSCDKYNPFIIVAVKKTAWFRLIKLKNIVFEFTKTFQIPNKNILAMKLLFNPSMHNVDKWSNILLKSCSVNVARFLKYFWLNNCFWIHFTYLQAAHLKSYKYCKFPLNLLVFIVREH